MQKLYLNIATMGFVGYLPAPGTIATVISFLFLFLFQTYCYSYYKIFFLVAISFSYFVILKLINITDASDPSEIVLDEFIGAATIFLFLKFNSLYSLFIPFLIFRFFDISKLMGISYLEKAFKGPLGILLDDIAAGLLTVILITILG